MRVSTNHLMGPVVGVILLAAGPCGATPQQIAWPTFFRAAPSHDATELQELDRGAVVDVLSCDGDACQVRLGRAIGYVDRAMLGPPNTPPVALMPSAAKGPAPDAPQTCVASREAGYERGLNYTYCQR